MINAWDYMNLIQKLIPHVMKIQFVNYLGVDWEVIWGEGISESVTFLNGEFFFFCGI